MNSARRLHPKFWLFSVLVFVTAAPTSADQQYKTVTIMGSRDCKTWTNDRGQSINGVGVERLANNSHVSWILGFLTGLNYNFDGGKDVLQAIDAGTVTDWIDRYCEQHPKKDTVDAAVKLFNELRKIAK